jgi:hypothetical protein
MHFVLDLSANRDDNLLVEVVESIYSPSDTPQGLRRGSVFMGDAQGLAHAR